MGTLISARLDKHYDQIVKDIDRTMLGYDLIKQINKITEDEAEEAWFDLLAETLRYLDNLKINSDVIKLWFAANVLRISGYTPNLRSDSSGAALQADKSYRLDESSSALNESKVGNLTANHIKLLRLAFNSHDPLTMQKIKGIDTLVGDCLILLQNMLHASLRI